MISEASKRDSSIISRNLPKLVDFASWMLWYP